MKKISKIEIFVIITLFIIGCANIVLTPLGAGYDEEQHLWRVWQMAQLQMVPKEMPWKQAKFPKLFYDISYRRQPLVESVGFDYWDKYGDMKLYDRGYYYGPINTRSKYNPILFLPQAMALRYSAWRFDLPALLIYYITRLAGLMTYIVLVWLAIRFIPFGKWMLLCLVISPAAIYQASTISADTITNGIGILFIGGTLAITNKRELGFKEWGWLALLITSVFITKPNLYPLVLLPFLCISPSRFWKKGAYILLVLVSIILFGIEVIGWNIISPNSGFDPSGNVNALEQIKLILSNPLWFPRVLVNDLFIYGAKYLTQWVGTYGYDYGKVPAITYILFLVGILLALLIPEPKSPDRRTRLGLLFVFFLCYIATELSLYVTYTAVGERFVYGVQGRYFIPIAPMLFLALSGLLTRQVSSIYQIVIFFSFASSVAYVAGLIFSFHVVCGASFYTRGLCYQPIYKNYSPLLRSTAPITNDIVLTQEIRPVCDGLTLLQARINSITPETDGQTEFILRDEDKNVAIVEKTVNNNELPEDAWYTLNFQPYWNSAGNLYTLTIRGKSTNGGPLFAYSLNPEYPSGVLYENGNPMENDIIFQYGCITGLEKLLR